MSTTNVSTPATGMARRSEALRVQQEIDRLCAEMEPGDRVPKHTDLMVRFAASERMVLNALSDLQRRGLIVRRHGAGTFVTDRRGVSVSPSPVIPSHTLVAVARPDHSFFDRCVEQLSQYAEEAGLDLMCLPLRHGRDRDALSPALLGQPKGVILFSYVLASLAAPLLAAGIRVVVVGTPPIGATAGVPCVYGAQDHGGYLAAKHLLDLGHQRLAFAHENPDQAHNPRWHGMQRAIRETRRAGGEAELILVAPGETDSWQRDPARAAAFVRRPDAPTGLLAWNDHEAARLLSALTRAGVRVPEEISVVGYDALPEGELVHPQLTTVDPFLGQLLQIAVGLLAQPDPPPLSHTAAVIPSLIVRASTASARRS